MGDHGLTRRDVESPSFVFHHNFAFQNNGELVEFWTLSWFFPSDRTAHVSDTGAFGLCVDATHVFIDELRFTSCSLDASRLRYERRQV